MKGMPHRTQALVASGLMAVLVLFVFANSTYTGPESTVQQLHEAVVVGDSDTIKQVLLQDPASPPSVELLGYLREVLRRQPAIELRDVQSQGRNAMVLVVYASPQIGVIGLPYYLHKARDKWQVDADMTLGAWTAPARF
jgi:hypothetical protein